MQFHQGLDDAVTHAERNAGCMELRADVKDECLSFSSGMMECSEVMDLLKKDNKLAIHDEKSKKQTKIQE